MKKTAMILLCTFLFGGMLSGCSNSKTDPQTETTVRTEQTETTTKTEQTDTLAPTEEETADSAETSTNSETSTAGTGTFDWDTAMSQATLDGKAIPMPFTMNDLGDEYSLGEITDDFFTNDGCCAGLNSSKEYRIAFLEFYHVLTDEYTDDCPVGYIGYCENISVQGVQEGISMEQVYEIWGQPSEWSDSHKLAYYYNVPDKRILLSVNDEGNVSSMDIYFEYPETEESE